MTDSESSECYRDVLAALEEGTAVSFNNSGHANALGTPELIVEVPDSDGEVLLAGGPTIYEVREYKNGELALFSGPLGSQSPPDNLHDVIETIEIVAEPYWRNDRNQHTDNQQ